VSGADVRAVLYALVDVIRLNLEEGQIVRMGDLGSLIVHKKLFFMAIRYNVIERGTPGVAGGGEKKYYATANITGETTLEGITKTIEKISTVSGADIRAVLYAMVDA
jgi:hypothetical protein